ncbi:MAG: sialidase family protein, partial [Verrucomicrobia bacterium]|nr:sialidase family protein [Verrucomicrobiota bacterium]
WSAVASSADGIQLFAVAWGPGGGGSGDCYWSSDGRIYRSKDAGATWTVTEAPITAWNAVACSADGHRAFAANNAGLLCSYPYSGPWRLADAPRDEYTSWTSVASSGDGAKLVAVTTWYDRICTSGDSGVTWQQTSAPNLWWSSVASSADGTQLVAASGLVNDQLGLIYRSSNSGTTWERTTAPSNDWSCVASSADGTQLAAAAWWYGPICISSNSGASWIQTSAPANNWNSISSSADGTKLVAAAAFAGNTSDGSIYISSNSGATWVRTTAPSNIWVSVSSSADGTQLVAAAAVQDGTSWGTGDGMIYTSADSGATWTPTAAPSNNWVSVSS